MTDWYVIGKKYTMFLHCVEKELIERVKKGMHYLHRGKDLIGSSTIKTSKKEEVSRKT